MACEAVLNVILPGANTRIQQQSATIQGYAIPCESGAVYPLIAAADGVQACGVMLQGLTDEDARRFTYFAEAIGAQMHSLPVTTDTGALCARVAVACGQAGAPLSNPDQKDEIARAAAPEIMQYYGRRSASQVARLRVMILSRAAARIAAQSSKPADLRSATNHAAVTVHSNEATHEGFFLTRTYQLQHPKFDGTLSPELTREVFIATDAAIVLPYDAKRDRVLLVEQFRMGPFGRGDDRPWMLEPVAGRVDGAETPEATARRECEEEAGLTLHRLEKISSHYCSPGDSTEYFHLFLGLCDLPDLQRGQGGLDTEDEDIRTHVISYDQAMKLIDTGEADNGPLILALLWLSKSRERLRATA